MIAIFLPSLRGGGAERNMVNLTEGLIDRGHTVVLVLARKEGPLLKEVSGSVEIVDLRARRVSTALLPLARFLADREPRALLATPTHANVVAVWARFLSRTSSRLVLREANTLSETSGNAPRMIGRLMPTLVRWSYPLADAIVAVSRGVAKDLQTTAGQSHVQVISNPAVTPDIPQKALEPVKHPWLANRREPLVVAVGSLTPQKDYPTLLRAIREILEVRPCRLLILGEGEERTSLERQVKKLGLSGWVDMPGFMPNPFSIMARADVLALSSRWEGWPNVCAQALAVGTPVVATNCPHGPAEILDGGRFGELVPVRDPVALAGALLRTLEAPLPADRLRARAQQYTQDRASESYAAILEPGGRT